MLKISSAEFHRNFGRYQDLALTEPVAVTAYGRERVVLLSAERYRRLTSCGHVAEWPFFEAEACRQLALALASMGRKNSEITRR